MRTSSGTESQSQLAPEALGQLWPGSQSNTCGGPHGRRGARGKATVVAGTSTVKDSNDIHKYAT